MCGGGSLPSLSSSPSSLSPFLERDAVIWAALSILPLPSTCRTKLNPAVNTVGKENDFNLCKSVIKRWVGDFSCFQRNAGLIYDFIRELASQELLASSQRLSSSLLATGATITSAAWHCVALTPWMARLVWNGPADWAARGWKKLSRSRRVSPEAHIPHTPAVWRSSACPESLAPFPPRVFAPQGPWQTENVLNKEYSISCMW